MQIIGQCWAECFLPETGPRLQAGDQITKQWIVFLYRGHSLKRWFSSCACPDFMCICLSFSAGASEFASCGCDNGGDFASRFEHWASLMKAKSELHVRGKFFMTRYFFPRSVLKILVELDSILAWCLMFWQHRKILVSFLTGVKSGNVIPP